MCDRHRELSSVWSRSKRSSNVRGKMLRAADYSISSALRSWRNNISGWDWRTIWFKMRRNETQFLKQLNQGFQINSCCFAIILLHAKCLTLVCFRIWWNLRRRDSVWKGNISRRWSNSTKNSSKPGHSIMPWRPRLTRWKHKSCSWNWKQASNMPFHGRTFIKGNPLSDLNEN